MKRFVILLISLIFVFSMVGCKNNNVETTSKENITNKEKWVLNSENEIMYLSGEVYVEDNYLYEYDEVGQKIYEKNETFKYYTDEVDISEHYYKYKDDRLVYEYGVSNEGVVSISVHIYNEEKNNVGKKWDEVKAEIRNEGLHINSDFGKAEYYYNELGDIYLYESDDEKIEYDANGNKKYEIDKSLNYECTYEYDEKQQLVYEAEIWHEEGEGKTIKKYEYDEYGNCMKKINMFDDGDVETYIYEREYDGKLCILLNSYVVDNKKGTKEYYGKDEYKYDEKGNMIKWKSYGIINDEEELIYEYNYEWIKLND